MEERKDKRKIGAPKRDPIHKPEANPDKEKVLKIQIEFNRSQAAEDDEENLWGPPAGLVVLNSL